MGVVGLETAFPVLYTELVKKNIITLEKLVDLMSCSPRRRFGIGRDVRLTVVVIEAKYTIDPNTFKTKGRATPFAGREVFGECVLTVYGGQGII